MEDVNDGLHGTFEQSGQLATYTQFVWVLFESFGDDLISIRQLCSTRAVSHGLANGHVHDSLAIAASLSGHG